MNIIEALRGAVRPLVTMALVGGFIAGAFWERNAAELIGPPAMLTVGFWFRSREQKQ